MNELAPRAVNPEQKSQRIPAKIQKYLENASFDYLQNHPADFEDLANPLEGLQISADIIQTAFLLGSDNLVQLPQTTLEARTAIQNGLDYRKNFLIQAKQLFYRDDESTLQELAIPENSIVEAKKEFGNARLTANFPLTNDIFKLVEERKALLPAITENILVQLTQNLTEKQKKEIFDHVSNLSSQAMLIRGFIFSAIGQINGINMSPFFISDQNLRDLKPIAEEIDLNMYIEPIVNELSKRISVDISPAQLSSLLTDYGYQVTQIFKRWINVQNASNFKENELEYWQKRNSVLRAFPIISLSPDVDYIDTIENLYTALRNGKPNPWQHAEKINGMIIPSLSDLELAEKIYYEAGIAEDDPKFDRIKKAIHARRIFQSDISKTNANIARLEGLLVNVNSFLEQSKDYSTVSVRSVSTIQNEIKEIETSVRRFDKAKAKVEADMNLYQEIKDLYENPNDTSEDRIKALVFRYRYDRQVRSMTKKTNLIKDKLYRPGWKEFFTLSMEGNYHSKERVHSELAQINKYLLELRANPDKVLPDDYTKDPEFLQKFIVNEMSALYRDLDQSSGIDFQYKKFVSAAIQMGLQKKIRWPGFRKIFIHSMSESKRQLEDLIQLTNKNEGLNEDMESINLFLDQGIIDERLKDALNGVSNAVVKNTVDDLKMTIVHEHEIARISEEDIKQGRTLVKLYRETHGQKQFKFPDRVLIDSYLRDQRTKKQRGKTESVEAFLDQLIKTVHSPLFPIRFVSGKTCSAVMQAFSNRLDYVSGTIYGNEKEERLQKVKEELAESKSKNEWISKTNYRENVLNLLRSHRVTRQKQRDRLISSLNELNFTIPEKKFADLKTRAKKK